MKSIVIFYSYGGNTRRVAEQIGKALGADLAVIQTVKPYTGSYNDVVNQGQREVNSGFLPKLQPLNIDLTQYDTVILGTPVWWYTFSPAMNSFLHDADLSGKTVYPFATNGGWLGHTFQDFKKACQGADVRQGLNVRFNEDRQLTPDADIQKWALRIKR
ncbi:MAG: flavodoxin [Candidatus Onthomonas sp.]